MIKKGGIEGGRLMLPGEISQIMVAQEGPSSSMTNDDNLRRRWSSRSHCSRLSRSSRFRKDPYSSLIVLNRDKIRLDEGLWDGSFGAGIE